MELCTTYKEVSRFHGKSLRHYLRYSALEVFSYLNASQYQKISGQPRIQFLYFHHVYEDEKANFDQLVSELARTHTFISHSEAVNRLVSNKVDKPYVTWSSDDGFRNNLTAAEILERYGASCCFFINPNSIGLTDPATIKKFCNEKLSMPATAFLNWQEVDELLKAGHEIGSHTMDHDLVTQLPLEDFTKDLQRSKEILESHCGPIAHFAYPYGRFEHFSKKAFDAVFQEGYGSCSTAVRGCHTVGAEEINRNELFIRRDQVVAAWPVAHTLYFMTKGFQNSNQQTHFIPESYLV